MAGRWTHIGINFGPPGAELWIDGVMATNTARLDTENGPVDCNQRDSQGIDGNSNPWGFGVDTTVSANGTVEPVDRPFAGGAIDHLRISGTQRDFSVPIDPCARIGERHGGRDERHGC